MLKIKWKKVKAHVVMVGAAAKNVIAGTLKVARYTEVKKAIIRVDPVSERSEKRQEVPT